MEIIVTVITLFFGYVVGLVQGGIHIYTGEKPKSQHKEQEYNQDYSSNLPPEVQQYYDKTSGFNDF